MSAFALPYDPDILAKLLRDPTPQLDDMDPPDDGPEEDRDLVAEQAKERLQALLEKLPPVDADVIEMTLQGKKQSDMAVIFGVSQAAISYRMHTAFRRIAFFSKLPDIPKQQFNKDLSFLDAGQKKLCWVMTQEGAQTRTAKALKITQARVRHVWVSAIALVKDEMASNPGLKVYYDWFTLINENLNLMHGIEIKNPKQYAEARSKAAGRPGYSGPKKARVNPELHATSIRGASWYD